MSVAELIAYLQQFHPDMRVFTASGSGNPIPLMESVYQIGVKTVHFEHFTPKIQAVMIHHRGEEEMEFTYVRTEGEFDYIPPEETHD